MLVAEEVHDVSEVGAHHHVHGEGQTHHEGLLPPHFQTLVLILGSDKLEESYYKRSLQRPHQKHQRKHIEGSFTQKNLII